MKLTASRKALADACKKATVPPASGHLPILGGLRLDAVGSSVTVQGTNLELTIEVDVACEVAKKGTAIVPGRLLTQLLAAAAGETVAISVDKDEAIIESGPTVATLRSFSLEDWPQVRPADGEHFELSGADVERIANVLHAVGKDSTKPHLTSVHFIDNRVEATDGHRLVVAQLGIDGMPARLVPAEIVKRVCAASPSGLTVTFDARSVTFDSGDEGTTWTSTLIAGEFPNVERLIRKESPSALTVNRTELADALKRVRLLADDGGEMHPVDLTRDGDKLTIAAARQDVGGITETIPCSGDYTARLRYHAGYLADLLAAHDGVDITLELEDSLKPAQARTADWRTVLVLMPMRPPA